MRLGALLIVLAAAPAFAQSTRYPPEPKDPDRDAEHHSKVWEEALDPGRTPYDLIVRDARQLSASGSQRDTQQAVDQLAKAVELMPKRPEAYALRGRLELLLKQWTPCADDLAAAEEHTPPDETSDRAQQLLDLGACQARAGRYADAERTLARAASTGSGHAEPWMRLGEVRIAMGKLDEAIGALETALEMPDVQQGFTRYLLATAFDRARLPGDAEAQMREGAIHERNFGAIETPGLPLLGPGEHEYMMGLAYRYALPRPEYALLYFRRFLAIAPDSPWRRRAEEHAHELSTLDLPQTIERRRGSANIDLEAARQGLVKIMPQLRACMAKLPTTALEVEVTRDGPRTPLTDRDHARFAMPQPGVVVAEQNSLVDTPPRDAIAAAQKCIEPIVDRVALPVPKERDTFYVIAFLVIAP
jgi:type IV pilus assembly protein PilF